MRKNICILFFIHFTNYLFPLLVLPYQLRILSIDNFADLSKIQAVVLTLSLIINFGYNLSATKDIANSIEQGEINGIYSNTIISKFGLMLLAYIILIVISFIDGYEELRIPLLVSSICFFGQVFFATWLFQGLEKLNGIAVSTTIAKLISISLTFLLVKEKDDLIEAVLTQNLGVFSSGIISLIYVKKEKLASFSLPKFDSVAFGLKKSFPFFLSISATSIYTSLNVFILSFFSTNADIANFSAADRLRMAAQCMLIPISQAVFPKINKRNKINIHDIELFSKRFILFGLIISLSMLLLGDIVVTIYFGSEYALAVRYFKCLFMLPVIIAFSIVLGEWYLISFGFNVFVSKVYIISAILHIIYTLALVYIYGVNGLIISITLTEIVVVFMFYWKVKLCIYR